MPDIYQQATDEIIAKLEKGTAVWQKPWSNNFSLPVNYVTGNPYKGVNALLLLANQYTSSFWLTEKQCKNEGGKIKSNEKPSTIIYFFFPEEKNDNKEGEPKKFVSPIIKAYKVFNVEQCKGLYIPKLTSNRIFRPARQIIENMPMQPKIIHSGNRAYYVPAIDQITMPHENKFNSSEEYYSTLFHELTHSTGHKSCLDRKGIKDICQFGSNNYSKEELIAEMGASFLCAYAGIENKTIDNSAAYIQSWLSVLRNDKKMIVFAAQQAQKATDYILGKNIKVFS